MWRCMENGDLHVIGKLLAILLHASNNSIDLSSHLRENNMLS